MTNQTTRAGGGTAWARGIVISYVLFAGATIAFGLFALSQPVDLVHPDYYRQGVGHQQQIDRMQATGQLPREEVYALRLEEDQLVLEFAHQTSTTGEVHLYRPSDGRLDRTVALTLDADGRQRIDVRDLAAGLWKVRVSWTAAGTEYFGESQLNLK